MAEAGEVGAMQAMVVEVAAGGRPPPEEEEEGWQGPER
jgi:hypothetical protein